MADNPQNVGLPTLLVDGIAHGLAVDGEGFVAGGVAGVPGLQGAVHVVGVDAGQHLANDGAAGNEVVAVAVTATKARSRFLAQSFAHRLIAL